MDTVTIPNAAEITKTTSESVATNKDSVALQRIESTTLEVQCRDSGKVSDGYHTFDSLYKQRMVLSAALAKATTTSWKSKLHHDGEVPFGGGWFIMGWETPNGSYTYHYQLEYWDMFECAELERAPEWDGHTDEDVERLLSL